MKKKTVKKLALAKETLVNLGSVRGGFGDLEDPYKKPGPTVVSGCTACDPSEGSCCTCFGTCDTCN